MKEKLIELIILTINTNYNGKLDCEEQKADLFFPEEENKIVSIDTEKILFEGFGIYLIDAAVPLLKYVYDVIGAERNFEPIVKELEVAYRSDDYAEFPEKVTIELSLKDLELIYNSINFMKENKGIWSVNIDVDVELDDDSDFDIGSSYLIVYSSGTCFVYVQNDYTAQLNFETDGFEI